MKQVLKKYVYGGIFATIVILVAYIVGMGDLNISPPFDIGFGQSVDIKAGILCICGLSIVLIIYFTFKKK